MRRKGRGDKGQRVPKKYADEPRKPAESGVIEGMAAAVRSSRRHWGVESAGPLKFTYGRGKCCSVGFAFAFLLHPVFRVPLLSHVQEEPPHGTWGPPTQEPVAGNVYLVAAIFSTRAGQKQRQKSTMHKAEWLGLLVARDLQRHLVKAQEAIVNGSSPKRAKLGVRDVSVESAATPGGYGVVALRTAAE